MVHVILFFPPGSMYIIALQDGGLATVATEMALLITSSQNLYFY